MMRLATAAVPSLKNNRKVSILFSIKKHILCWWYLVCCCVCILYSISQMKTKSDMTTGIPCIISVSLFWSVFPQLCINIFDITESSKLNFAAHTCLLQRNIFCLRFLNKNCLTYITLVAKHREGKLSLFSAQGEVNYFRPYVALICGLRSICYLLRVFWKRTLK